MTLPPYPEYRASGVEWLGEVPAHWEDGQLGQYLRSSESGAWGTKDDPDGTIVLRSTDQTADGKWVVIDPAKRNLSDREKINTTLKYGDLLITKSSGSAFHIGKTTFVDEYIDSLAAGYSNFMQRIRCNDRILSKFLYWFVNAHVGREQFAVAVTTSTGLGNLNRSSISSLRVPSPPLPEQRAIVAYLDRETARIDDLVAKKRRLLALLKERRTAVITHAVTKGLPPDEARAAGLPVDPPMKDSGVEWLGEVPAHWAISDLGACSSKVGSGKTPLGGAETYETEGVPFLRSQNIHNEGLRLTDVVFINDHVHHSMMSSAVNPGDNLLNITGASIGRSCVVPINLPAANVNQHVCIIRARPDTVVNYYLHFYIISALFQDYINSVQNGTSRQGLNFQQIRSSAIGIPPLPEQRAIVTYLDRETVRLDALAAKVEVAIAALGEYRTALITAAVTGQVDVRGAVEAW